MELLFQQARDFKFDDFSRLFQQLTAGRPPEAELREAYLLRAQIKLFAADATALDDLEQASGFSGPPRFQRLSTFWPAETPNWLAVFPTAPGALRAFLQTLPQVRQRLNRIYGEQGEAAARQLEGEIHYFLGETQAALRLAEERPQTGPTNNVDGILAQCLRFRCYLALSRPRQAEECLLDLVRLAQACPECQATYKAMRLWVNLTTNWSGDSPRFYDGPAEIRMPILEDRLESIRMGNAHMTPLEGALLRYAQAAYGSAYSLRQYYMDIFHAMYWFQAGDRRQTESYFLKLHRLALDSGLIMPFVECGEQSSPLLRHVQDSGWACSQQWLDLIAAQAGQYEKGVRAYQDSDA